MPMQPFEHFSRPLLNRLIKQERFYLVSQTYHRVKSDRPVLLLTDYQEPGGAKIHLNAVKGDRWAAVINLRQPVHLKKLDEIMRPGSPYEIYFAAVQSTKALEKQLAATYKNRLREYVDRETNWRLDRGTINTSLELTFGELYVLIRNFGQQIRVRLSEIEAMPA